MIFLLIGLIFACIFWFLIFGLNAIHFWWGMAFASGVLAVLSIISAGRKRREIFRFGAGYFVWGIISAAGLYIIFWVGKELSSLIFSFTPGQIAEIYSKKSGLASWIIGPLLFFWIGPAEEIFWRGMVQRLLSNRCGPLYGWIFGALIYAAVHLWAANFILVMAALICGLFWGWIYLKTGSLWPGIISHALWDVAIFLIAPP